MKRKPRMTLEDRAREWAYLEAGSYDGWDTSQLCRAWLAGYRAARRDARKGKRR